jgi:cyanophycinase
VLGFWQDVNLLHGIYQTARGFPMRETLDRRAATAFLFLLLAPFSLSAAAPATGKEPYAEVRGSLVLVGGGKLPDAARDRFFELAGGMRAKIVVIPTASGDADGPDAEKALEPWKSLKSASVVVLHTRDKKKADDPDFAKPLTEATGVWFGGGDQSKIMAAYLGTAVEKELHKLLERGGVIGGTSAGAAIASRMMIENGTPRANVGTGFDFLPGFVVDQHFLKRNRADRLLGVLTEHPGMAGLGIDEATAAVVHGRRIQVLGDSYVTVLLSASKKRPASMQTLKAGDGADIIQIQRAAFARTQSFPPEKPAPPVVEKGTLIIGGGGGMPAEVWKQFIELAGGPDALIVVVPTALEDPIPEEPGEAKALRTFGAKNIKILHTRSRAEADKPEFAAPLKEAGGVWFTGGRQWHFVDSYEGTLTEKMFHEVLKRGGVIAGSSAGASIQTEYMPRGHPLGNLVMMAEGYERGFGFLPGVAVDQHFFARKRTGDMAELVRTYPQFLGIGIDEGTVLIAKGAVIEVVGKSKVAVFDRAKPVKEGEKDYEELTAGMKYDMKARKRVDEK